MNRTLIIAMALAALAFAEPSRADTLKLAREAAEFAIKKYGSKAVGESADSLAPRIAAAAGRYGEATFSAVRRAGPKAIRFADEAARINPQHGAEVIRLFNRHGDDAAIIARNASAISLAARHGDPAASLIIRSRGAATPVIAHFGEGGLRALTHLSPRHARQLAMLDSSGDLLKIGRTDELLAVIGRFGDKGMQFIFDHRTILAASGGALAAFLLDPEPYIDGAVDLVAATTESIAEHALAPIAGAAAPAIRRTASLAVPALGFLVIAVPVAMAALTAAFGVRPLLTLAMRALTPVPPLSLFWPGRRSRP